ncbi:hypothetical protein, partial [Vibrio nigripulchritudo]|uniref:hypothetical protein n=1 Tax=Vibrio nigripulchritudo TaxID=28173 RepID=UPI001F1EBF16
MSELNMKQFLENVISGKSNRLFSTLDGKSAVHIPLLVRSKQPKTLSMYSTNFSEIAASKNLSTNPVRVQLQNVVKGAMFYSVFQQLGKEEPLAQKLNASINAFYNGRGSQKRFSKELEKEVNSIWREIVGNDKEGHIIANAKLMVDTAIHESSLDGELSAAKVSLTNAKNAAELFIQSFQSNILHSSNTPLSKASEISAVFTNAGERVQEFLNQRFGSTHDEHYLRMLLMDNSSALQHLGDKINVDMTVIAADIPFRKENDSPSPQNSIPTSVYRKARINNKKGVRGKISAYIKRDGEFGDFGVSHLIVNVTEHDGSQHINYNEMLFSHTIDPLDGTSKNELTNYLKVAAPIQPYFTAERLETHLENEKRNAERRASFEAQVIQENIAKREEALTTYNTLQDVSSAEQLRAGYFGQSNVAELAVKYIHGLKVTPDNNVWLPLANVIQQKPVGENIEAFQELLAEKPDWTDTNKLFQGLGDGYKHKCSVTLGDPNSASVIGISEGVKNGLIQVEMARQRGIDLAIVCALDVGNLTAAVKKVIDEHPTKPLINFSDNDLFNSSQQRRFLRHELEAQGIEPNGKNTNIGMDKAIEIHQAINLPYIAYDFERDIEGMNLLGYQQSNKGSDIDDLLNAVHHELESQGNPNSQQEAWDRVSDLLEHKIESTMKYSVSPHWTKERQNDFGWCPSLENLSEQRLPNYYHMKESIAFAQEVFSKERGVSYDVYQSMVQTQHWSPSNEEMASMIVSDPTIEEYESAIDTHVENVTNGITDVNPDSVESEPMSELDIEFNTQMSPTIDEKVSKVDAKIAAITRRIGNLQQNEEKYPSAKFDERMIANSRELDRLHDERARLLGVSANHGSHSSSLNQYYDRTISEKNDPLVINQDTGKLRFESLDNAEPIDNEHVDSQGLLRDVFKQHYDKEESPAAKQDEMELWQSWVQNQKNELDALLENPHADITEQLEAFRSGVSELELHLNSIEINSADIETGSLKNNEEYSLYYSALEKLEVEADESLNVRYGEQGQIDQNTPSDSENADLTWSDGILSDASHHEQRFVEDVEQPEFEGEFYEHYLNGSEPEHLEAAALDSS